LLPHQLQRIAKRVFIDDRSARGVEEKRAALHPSQGSAVDQMSRLAAERDMDGNEVARGQENIERLAPPDSDNFEAERQSARRDRRSDPAHADNAETFSLKRGAQKVQGLPDASPGTPHLVVALDQPALGQLSP